MIAIAAALVFSLVAQDETVGPYVGGEKLGCAIRIPSGWQRESIPVRDESDRLAVLARWRAPGEPARWLALHRLDAQPHSPARTLPELLPLAGWREVEWSERFVPVATKQGRDAERFRFRGVLAERALTGEVLSVTADGACWIALFASSDQGEAPAAVRAALACLCVVPDRAALEDRGRALTALLASERKERAGIPRWEVRPATRYVWRIHDDAAPFSDDMMQEVENLRARAEAEWTPECTSTEVSLARLLPDFDAYVQFGAPGGTRGYMTIGEGLMLFVEREHEIAFTLETARFVTALHFLELAAGAKAHPWFRFGVAAHLAGNTYDVDEEEVERALRLPVLLRTAERKFDAAWRLYHVRSAELVAFLYETRGTADGAPLVLRRYFDTVRETRDRERALTHAFDGIDVAALEAEFEAWRRQRR